MNRGIFTVDVKKAKHLYKVQNDSTTVDSFIINLQKEFGDTFIATSVRGISAGENKFTFKQLPYGFTQKAVKWQRKVKDNTNIREYYLKLYVNYDKVPLKICNMEWVTGINPKSIKGTEKDFLDNRDRAYRLIETFFKKHTTFFTVSVFCAELPGSSWSPRCYLKVIFRLPVKGIDVFVHSGISNLTDFGQCLVLK